jgi:hypothetical protein
LQKENDLKASFGGIKLSDLPSKDPAGSFGVRVQSTGTKMMFQMAEANFLAITSLLRMWIPKTMKVI